MKQSDFLEIFHGEAKHIFSKKKLAAFVVLLICIFFVINSAISTIKDFQSTSSNFLELETSKFKKVVKTYTVYSTIGIRYLPAPSSLAFLSLSDNFANNAATVDIGGLEILKNIKGKGLFPIDSNSPFSLSFLIQLLGIIGFMFYGANLQDRITVYSHNCIDPTGRKIFRFIFFARLLLILAIMAIIFAAVILILFINGIVISIGSLKILSGYFLAAAIMLYTAFLLGIGLGMSRKKNSVLPNVLIACFIIIYLVPGTLNFYIAKKANDITLSYSVELEQLAVLIDFEKKVSEKLGAFSEEKRKEFGEMAENEYYNKGYKEIEQKEEALKNEIIKVIDLNEKLAVITPVTFFKTCADEASSLSYTNAIRFYDFLIQQKRKFLRFYLDRIYKHNPKEIVQFDTPQVFFNISTLPSLFWYGVLFNLAVIAVLYLWVIWRFNNRFYMPSTEKLDTIKLNIPLKSGIINHFVTAPFDFFRRFLSVFHGHNRHFKGKMLLDTQPLKVSKNDVLVVYNQSDMPGEVLLKDFIRQYTKELKFSDASYSRFMESVDNSLPDKLISEIPAPQRADILLALAENADRNFLLFYDFLNGLELEDKRAYGDRLLALCESGKTVCYFAAELWQVIPGALFFNISLYDGQYSVYKVN